MVGKSGRDRRQERKKKIIRKKFHQVPFQLDTWEHMWLVCRLVVRFCRCPVPDVTPQSVIGAPQICESVMNLQGLSWLSGCEGIEVGDLQMRPALIRHFTVGTYF